MSGPKRAVAVELVSMDSQSANEKSVSKKIEKEGWVSDLFQASARKAAQAEREARREEVASNRAARLASAQNLRQSGGCGM